MAPTSTARKSYKMYKKNSMVESRHNIPTVTGVRKKNTISSVS